MGSVILLAIHVLAILTTETAASAQMSLETPAMARNLPTWLVMMSACLSIVVMTTMHVVIEVCHQELILFLLREVLCRMARQEQVLSMIHIKVWQVLWPRCRTRSQLLNFWMMFTIWITLIRLHFPLPPKTLIVKILFKTSRLKKWPFSPIFAQPPPIVYSASQMTAM